MVAPFAPGGPVDVVARVLAPKLSERLGQQFYVENHPGGSGNIGTALVARAPPDGYTVLVISSTLVVNPSPFARLGFDTTTDLAPVSLVGVSPQVLLVHPSVPALAVTGARRSAVLPDVPTLAEAGAADQESEIILGVLVPGGTPRDVIARLHREIVTIVASPDVRERLLALGFEPIASTPEEFAARITWEIDKWARVIRAADVKLQ